MIIDWAFKYKEGDILEDKDRVRYEFVASYYRKDTAQTYYELRLVAVPSVVYILEGEEVGRRLNIHTPYLAEGDYVVAMRFSNTFDTFKEGEIVEIKNINPLAKVAVTADCRLIPFVEDELGDNQDFITLSRREVKLRKQFL